MDRLFEWFHHALDQVQPFAERLGGPGLALVAFFDSSFISLPEVSDALIVFLVLQHPGRWLYYGLLTTAGSIAGCYTLYALARRGGETFLRKRFNQRRLDQGLGLFRRYGLFAVVVPSILPPPTPFKIFVLLAGVAKVRPPTFLLALLLGRGFRYIGEAWLAYMYGAQATAFIKDYLPHISMAVAGLVVLGGIAALVIRARRRQPAGPGDPAAR
jgi:membrane protein YqaA with SNARE-associated domain